MLLKGDVTTIVQKWGLTPRYAAPKMGLASDGQFSSRFVHTVFDSGKRNQTRLRHFIARVKLPRLGWKLIETGKRIGCVRSGLPNN